VTLLVGRPVRLLIVVALVLVVPAVAAKVGVWRDEVDAGCSLGKRHVADFLASLSDFLTEHTVRVDSEIDEEALNFDVDLLHPDPLVAIVHALSKKQFEHSASRHVMVVSHLVDQVREFIGYVAGDLRRHRTSTLTGSPLNSSPRVPTSVLSAPATPRRRAPPGSALNLLAYGNREGVSRIYHYTPHSL